MDSQTHLKEILTHDEEKEVRKMIEEESEASGQPKVETIEDKKEENEEGNDLIRSVEKNFERKVQGLEPRHEKRIDSHRKHGISGGQP